VDAGSSQLQANVRRGETLVCRAPAGPAGLFQPPQSHKRTTSCLGCVHRPLPGTGASPTSPHLSGVGLKHLAVRTDAQLLRAP
jgi:hypothetical protein